MNNNDFLEKQLDMIKDIQDGNSTWQDLQDFRADFYGNREHIDTVSKGGKIIREYINSDWIHKPSESTTYNNKKNISINKDGSQTCNETFRVDNSEKLKDIDSLLKLHGYNEGSEKWDIISSRNTLWGPEGDKLCASSITVKPKEANWKLEDVDEYFKTKEFKNISSNFIPTNYDPDGEVLEITCPDIHAGLLSYQGECGIGENYDIKIVKERFYKCISDIIERIKDKKFSKIYLVPLGDLLHVDNAQYSSSRFTVQDCDGRYTKMFNNTLDMLIDTVEMLSKFSKVHVPYISGNHSRVMEYTLIKALEVAFRNNDNVYIDAAPTPSKFEHFGNVLIGWSHGDSSKDNVAEWLQSYARKEFGNSRYVEVHLGHKHTTMTIEKSGMIIRHLPTICSSSSWENQQLYNKGVKTMVSFVWNPNNGLREMWYSNI